MRSENYSDIIAGIDAMTNALARIKTAIQREQSESEAAAQQSLFSEATEILSAEETRPARVSISDPLKPTRNTKHARNGLIDIVKVKAALGVTVSNGEFRDACDKLGIYHQQVGHSTYIHYWNTETLKKYFEK